jgi:hypothetical protein
MGASPRASVAAGSVDLQRYSDTDYESPIFAEPGRLVRGEKPTNCLAISLTACLRFQIRTELSVAPSRIRLPSPEMRSANASVM